MLGLLGGLGLTLALVGVFGMTAYAVTRRTAEIGVRMAFGARPGQVVRTMVREAAVPIAVGTVLGVGGAALATRVIESFLFETAPTDPVTLAAVAVTLADGRMPRRARAGAACGEGRSRVEPARGMSVGPSGPRGREETEAMMTSTAKISGPVFLYAVAVAAMVAGLYTAEPKNFKPDGTFTGSALTGWRVLGDAEWKAQNGELVGAAKPGTAGGWLIMDKSFQDVRLFANYRCTGECRSGVLLRARRTSDGGLRGVFVSLTDGEVGSYSVTLDAQGRETGRERLVAPAGGRGRGAAPAATPATPSTPAPATPPRARARQRAGRGPRGWRWGRRWPRRCAVLKAGDWNEVEIILALSSIRSTFGGNSAVDEPNVAGYGAVALFVGGTGEVRYKDVAWKNLNSFVQPKEEVSRAIHDAAGQQPLLRLGRVDRRHRSGRDARHRGGPVLLPWAVVHGTQAVSRRPRVQPGGRVRARHGEPRRRLHR